MLAFIVGFPRSGTTFLVTQLARSDEVVGTPETRYVREMIHERTIFGTPVKRSVFRRELLARLRLNDLDLDLEQVLESYEGEKIDRWAFFVHLLECFRHRHSANLVLEKSPIHTLHTFEILEKYPDARVIGIIRDGRDALASLRKTPWAKNSDKHYAADWVHRNTILLSAREAYPDRVRLVRFEDCVNSPAVLEDLRIWLKVSSTFTERTPGASLTVPDWELEWKGKALTQADQSRAGAWKQPIAGADAGQRDFQNIAGDMLRLLGYQSSRSTFSGRVYAKFYRILFIIKNYARQLLILVGLADQISSDRGLQRLLDQKG